MRLGRKIRTLLTSSHRRRSVVPGSTGFEFSSLARQRVQGFVAMWLKTRTLSLLVDEIPDCQLFLEATKPAHFINKGQISAQVPAQELSSLTTHVRCLFCCLPHSDLDNCLGICYQRVSLAPAREFEVKADCFNFGVSERSAFLGSDAI